MRIHEDADVRRKPDLCRFEGVLRTYIAHLRMRGYSPSVQKQARLFLPRFFFHLKEAHVHDLRAVQEEHVFAYARELATTRTLKGTPYSFASQTSYLMQIKRLFKYLEEAGLILSNPTRDLVLPTWSKLPRVVPSEAQVRRLLSVANSDTVLGKRDRAVLELLYGSGVRVGECERLDVQDLDLGQGTLFVRNGKGRKDRVVPVAGRAALAVEIYLEQARPDLLKDPREQAVFLNTRGQRLSRKSIQAFVRQQVQAAGIPVQITPHGLRHGCATHMLQRGADVRHVQKLLGHSQLQTTALYTKVVPADLAKTVARAHPRERTYNRRRSKASCRKGGR